VERAWNVRGTCVERVWNVRGTCVERQYDIEYWVHPFSSLSHDRTKASPKASSPHSAI
jgi:hypothetical protein